MRRTGPRIGARPWALLACAAVLALLTIGALVLALGGNGPATPADAQRPSATATLSSRTILFGDTVEAELDMIVPRRLSGLSFRGHPNFSPFRIVSDRVDRANLGDGLERISLRYGLACLTRRCLSAGATVKWRFAPTSVSIPGGRLRASWPPLVQVSRAQNVSAPVADGLATGPAVPPGLEPRLDTYEALGAAAASFVALLAAWLYLRRRAALRLARMAKAESLLQALLARVEAGLPEDVMYRQRHALDALAVELRHRRIDGSLAVHAERLAWAPEEPDPAEIRSLCLQIREVAKA